MMVDPRLFALAPRHITVSTVGVVPRILQLAHDFPRVSFALSLHAPNQARPHPALVHLLSQPACMPRASLCTCVGVTTSQTAAARPIASPWLHARPLPSPDSTAPTVQALRESIVPSAKAHKLPKLIAAIKEYQTITARKVFIEYVMLEGVNDEPHHAEELAKLLEGHAVTVNLIPWNPVLSPDMTFGAPSVARVRLRISAAAHALPVMTCLIVATAACGHARCRAVAGVREYKATQRWSTIQRLRAPVLVQVQAFRAILHNAHGIRCTVRQEKGQEISGACGQLVLESRGSKNTGGDAHGGKGAVRDIEELAARMAACA